ncbi:MAG: PD-(D/E)XK nuclease family protein [bacterium]
MIKWSFSGLKQYLNCPNQYHEIKILKNYEIKVSPQMLYGTEVHKALEDYARDGIELPKFYLKYKPMIDALLEIPGEKYLEYKMALSADKLPCNFDAPDYWVRGIVDFMVIDTDTAFIIDYKTGSAKYPDPKQLKLMALMTFASFPSVNHVKAGLLFVAYNSFMPAEYRRKDIDLLWKDFSVDLSRMEHSADKDWWPMNPTGLCGWCPVITCEHHRSR